MAQWSKNKVDPLTINGGKEFTTDNNFSLDELNAVVNNSFYASEKAKEALDKANNFIATQRGTNVTIGGSPQGTWSADFVENERQKSKNLFNINNVNFGKSANYDGAIDYENGVITLYQGENDIGLPIKDFTDLEIGKIYTLSFKTTSSIKHVYLNGSGFLWESGTSHIITQDELENSMHIYGENNTTVTIENFQIEEGTVATDYQPYNGQIVHKKEISDVEHIELVYDNASTDPNINWGYLSGISNTSVTGKNFSKYKELRIYDKNGGETVISLTHNTSGSAFEGRSVVRCLTDGSLLYVYSNYFTVNLEKTSITFEQKYHSSGGSTEDYPNQAVYKIKGVC